MPRVAILLPAYNALPYLHETIAAIDAQTMTDYIVLATDDGSSDDTFAVLEAAARRDPARWRVFRNPRNLGMTPNWNRLVTLQREHAPNVDYVYKLDGDDVPDPTLLARAVAELDADADAVLCHFRLRVLPQGNVAAEQAAEAGVAAISERLERHGISLAHSHRVPGALARWLLVRYANMCASSGTVMRRRALDAAGPRPFHERLRWAPDYDLWCRLADVGAFRYVSDVAVWYRVHAASVTAHTATQRQRRETWLIALRALVRAAAAWRVRETLALLPIVTYRARTLVTRGA